MTFTDEDLQQLKKLYESESNDASELWSIIPALLARLEAAERAMRAAYSAPFAMIQGRELYEEWRKSAGK